MATAFIRSLLSWQQAIIANASYPCPAALLVEVDLEKAAVSFTAAKKWTAFLAFMAGNFEKIVAEAVPSCDDHRVEVQKKRIVLAALRDAHRHARGHVVSLEASTAHRGRQPPLVSLAFVRSIVHWQSAMIGAIAHPTSYALLSDVDLEKAATDPDSAREWGTFLGTIAKKLTDLVADAETRRVTCPLTNAEYMITCLGRALTAAQEHVASFSDASAPVAASKPPT
jgi:hypothetical protein